MCRHGGLASRVEVATSHPSFKGSAPANLIQVATSSARKDSRPQSAYDDRVDLASDISSGRAWLLLARSLALLRYVPWLFAGKAFFAIVAILPGLALPWMGRVVVDQVLLGKLFGESDARLPPFMEPFISLVDGMAPMEIMLVILAICAGLLALFGLRAPAFGILLTEGRDAATQSELRLSAGGSKAGGAWGVLETLIDIRLSQRIANHLRTRLFGRLTRLPITTLDDQRIGDSVYRVMYDAPLLPDICFGVTLTPLLILINVALSLYFMEYSYGEVAPEAVWMAAALAPLAFIVTAPLSRLARRINQASRASGAATTNSLEQSVDNVSAVQSLGGMNREAKRFEVRSEESFRRHRHVELFGYGLAAFGIFGTVIGGIFVAVVVTERIFAGQLTPGDWVSVTGVFFSLGASALSIGTFWIGLQGNIAAVRRVFFFLDHPVEPDAEEEAVERPFAPLRRAVALRDVDFEYPDGRRALTGVDLEFRLGEMVALVGPTGAGKTTLAYLVPGFLRPTRGRVLFDDVDAATLSPAALRRQVSYVFQEHVLLSRSIRDNFLLVRPDASDADILAACEAAGAKMFVGDLPDGLDTVLGRGGETLSVGQQQRLSIARGLVRDTPVLILDEPTAALDPQTERILVQSLRAAGRGRLVVVIAHRLSTIREADRIVFLDAGRVRAVGDHETLMRDPRSPYRRFADLQRS